jgi:uncharacterized protein YukE
MTEVSFSLGTLVSLGILFTGLNWQMERLNRVVKEIRDTLAQSKDPASRTDHP